MFPKLLAHFGIHQPKAEWHHISRVKQFGKETLYCDGKPKTYQPDIWFDEVRVSKGIARIGRKFWYRTYSKDFDFGDGDFTIDYWIGIGFSIKHWTYAQKWSLGQCLRRYV